MTQKQIMGKSLGNGNGKIKNQVITWGALAAVLATAITIVSWTRTGEKEIRIIATEQVERHVDRDLVRAHPDLPKRYVTKQDFKDALYKIEGELMEIRNTQKQILERMPRWKHWSREAKYTRSK